MFRKVLENCKLHQVLIKIKFVYLEYFFNTLIGISIMFLLHIVVQTLKYFLAKLD